MKKETENIYFAFPKSWNCPFHFIIKKKATENKSLFRIRKELKPPPKKKTNHVTHSNNYVPKYN